ncbi:hypothetical protein DL765_007856 [Monosporascus sp. GIB2]|nr:hypothetical protein DL765_007856 [Monosporascus sp. GIB2]
MHNDSPIAIVGLSYRAPGVGRKGLWEFLAEKKSAWSRVPADRFDQDAFYHPNSEKAGCFSSQGGHFLPDDIYAFDAAFFNLRAEEARAIDPQHRLMLECAFEAAESAGLSLSDVAGADIGVFAAIGSLDFGQQVAEDLPSTSNWSATGQASCSSYALHLACQSLRAGECSAAFVGGVHLLTGPNLWSGHGTGTAGDPVEASSFAATIGCERTPSNPLYIGSVKSNLGYALTLKSPLIRSHKTFSYTFGFGGSNAAILVEEAPRITGFPDQLTGGTDPTSSLTGMRANDDNGIITHKSHDLQHRLFVFSAKSEASLTTYLASFVEYLDTAVKPSNFTKDLSYTLGQRRTHHSYRVAVTADTCASLRAQLVSGKITKIKAPSMTFVFTGQGAQHARMAAGLRRYKSFVIAIDQAEVHFRELGATWSLTAELNKTAAESRINDAEISQPACTAVQLAVVLLLRSWGIKPSKVTGHSSGEIAAAFAAGLVSFRAALSIAYFRGYVVAELAREGGQKGGMLALGASFDEAAVLLSQNTEGKADIAAINSPKSVTVSGDEVAVENIHRIANAQGMFARRLKVPVAYHSRHMEPLVASYLALIKPHCDPERISADQGDSSVVFVSSVTGRVEDANTVNASYWARNLVEPVRFKDAMETILALNANKDEPGQRGSNLPGVVIEIGPHCALKSPIIQTAELAYQNGQNRARHAYLPSLVRGTRDDVALLDLVGGLFSRGSEVQIEAVNQTSPENAQVLANLPPYAWEKSTRYIHTSQITQEKLHSGQPYDPLLGWKIPLAGGGGHTFRQVFTLDEIPWIQDHNVGGQVIYPLSGYVSLVVEALRRVSPTRPNTVLLREVHAKRSLVIEQDGRVDISTKLMNVSTGTEAFSATAWSFQIASWSAAEGWTTHCFGQVESEAVDLTLESPTMKASVPLIESTDFTEHDVNFEYDRQGPGGIRFGSTFRSMVNLREGHGWTVIETELRDLDQSLPLRYGSPVSVDPPTLDSFFHGIGPLQEVEGGRPVQVPNYISRLRVSNNIPASEKQKFTSVLRLLEHDIKAGTMRVSLATFAQTRDSLVPVGEWESVTLRTIGSLKDQHLYSELPWSFRWDYIPDMDFIDTEYFAKDFVTVPIGEDELLRRHRMERAAVYYIDRALKQTAGDAFSQLPTHLAKFVTWARKIVARRESVETTDPSLLLTEVSNSDAQGEMLCRVGEQLVTILRGEVQPLEIMLRDRLLWRSYEQDSATARWSHVLAKHVRHLAKMNPDLNVLEVGGGTGSATLPVLQELSLGASESGESYHYTFTDISAGFFEDARKKLAQWSGRITYKKLDISQDPVGQGFAPEQYDLVIAANVLHATPNMATTIDHVRTLLRPYGKLLLLETIDHNPVVMPFSLLSSWWIAEDGYRSPEEGPLLSRQAWQDVLSARGFSGLDSAVTDYPGTSDELLAVFCSTRIGKPENHDRAPIPVCGPFWDKEEERFSQMVSEHVTERLGCPSPVKPFSELDSTQDSVCIVIDSPDYSIFQNVSKDSFDTLKNILVKMKGILWVLPENYAPDVAIVKGILRTLRLEDESRNILMLENIPRGIEGSLIIAKIAQRLRDPEIIHARDKDFVWRDGMIQVPRLQELRAAKDIFASESGMRITKTQNIWENDDALQMTVDTAGSPDSIYFRRTGLRKEQLGEDEVLIRMEAAGMNFRDLLVVLGSIPWSNPGDEGVGVVVRTGSCVENLKPGDRVFFGALGGGAFATYLKMPSWRACKVPDDMNSAEVASMPVVYFTAIMVLMRVARLSKGETVLIHAASGAVGQACIVLTQHLGANIFATAGGIGISLASWMIDNGARNVVLLGRTGSSRPKVKKLLERLEGTEATVKAVACDVGSRKELEQALQTINTLPPVRGVIHGALHLRGAWNIHDLLPDLDFFLTLSTAVNATGNIGQSVYAGTSSFFEALAQYRAARGQSTVTIGLPVVLDIGYVADRDLSSSLPANVMSRTLTEAHLLTLTKGVIIGTPSGLTYEGQAMSFSFFSRDYKTMLPARAYHPLVLVRKIVDELSSPKSNSVGQDNALGTRRERHTNGEDPLLNLLDALMSKVSSITLIERDEVEPDLPLSTHSAIDSSNSFANSSSGISNRA